MNAYALPTSLLVVIVLCLPGLPALGQEWEETTEEDFKLTASDAAADDWFGRSVSISGEFLVVGAFRDDDDGSESGSAYLFRFDPDTEEWVEEQKLTSSDGAGGDEFAASVSISGERLVVGSRSDDDEFDMPIRRATTWLEGMQSSNGGFGSFDVDNAHYSLNDIPFADHGALLDPPTADVSARCLTLFGLLGRSDGHPASRRCLDYIFAEQEANGSWFGRWGTNYIYGTWSVLMALEQVHDARKPAAVSRAVEWLQSVQRDDGSWGEGNDTYFFPDKAGQATTGTAFQTAWALLGLLAASSGDSPGGDSPAVRRGVDSLLRAQREHGLWEDESFTAPGFPRVFYLKYHGYTAYFPLWALARYRRTLGA